jgi:uncharacterized protein YciI
MAIATSERTGFFLVMYDIGPNYLRGLPLAEQPGFREHARYLDMLHTGGKLLLGGLLRNHLVSFSTTGGALLLCASSEEKALELAAEDPAVKNNVFDVRSVKHFIPMIGQLSGARNTNNGCQVYQAEAS